MDLDQGSALPGPGCRIDIYGMREELDPHTAYKTIIKIIYFNKQDSSGGGICIVYINTHPCICQHIATSRCRMIWPNHRGRTLGSEALPRGRSAAVRGVGGDVGTVLDSVGLSSHGKSKPWKMTSLLVFASSFLPLYNLWTGSWGCWRGWKDMNLRWWLFRTMIYRLLLKPVNSSSPW